jgi:hypothetical protein
MDGCFEEVFKEQGSTGDTTEVVILQSHKGLYLYSYSAAHGPKYPLLHTVSIVFYYYK